MKIILKHGTTRFAADILLHSKRESGFMWASGDQLKWYRIANDNIKELITERSDTTPIDQGWTAGDS